MLLDKGLQLSLSRNSATPPQGPMEANHGGYEDSSSAFTQARQSHVAVLPLFQDT